MSSHTDKQNLCFAIFFLISATVRKLQYIIVTFEQVYFAIQKRDQQPVQASEWNLSNENLSISILGQTMVTPLPRPNGNIYLYVYLHYKVPMQQNFVERALAKIT